MIKLEKGSFFYGKNQILYDINLEIKKGDKVAIIGHNGAGKSTLIDVLIGIKKLKKGDLKYNIEKNQEIQDILGVQFQNKNFPTGLKAKNLLQFYLDLYNLKMKDQKVQKLLKEYKLDKKLNIQLKRMSGGQQQKFNILTSILNEPKILMVDEILTGLDITSQENVINSLENKIKKDKDLTFVTVSHSPAELKRLVNRIIVLEKGRKIYDTTIKEIIKKHKTLEKFLEKLVEHE